MALAEGFDRRQPALDEPALPEPVLKRVALHPDMMSCARLIQPLTLRHLPLRAGLGLMSLFSHLRRNTCVHH
jgi:hypothetical protein